MHIVYVIAPGGGPEAYVRTMTPALAQTGYRVSIVYTVPAARIMGLPRQASRVLFAPPTLSHYYLAKIIGNFRALPLRLRAWETARAVVRTLQMIDKANPIDLVEVTEGLPTAAIRGQWHTVVHAHGSAGTFRYFCQDRDRRVSPWLLAMEAKQLRDAQHIVALSEHLANHLSTMYCVPRERIHVFPYPIDTLRFQPNHRLHQAGVEQSLLTVGRLEKRKGIDMLLHALNSDVWSHFPDLKACLLGSEGDLKKAALVGEISPGKRDRIIFAGFVNHSEVAQYYQAATLYVAPTRYETFGYTILEAMACGLAVVSTRVGAVPELVADGVTGLLVPYGDSVALAEAINALLGDSERRERMGQNAREKALAEFRLDDIVERTLSYYTSLQWER